MKTNKVIIHFSLLLRYLLNTFYLITITWLFLGDVINEDDKEDDTPSC
ncbi:MAG: hypothetical protein Q8770_02630 [Sweet potato little leaf phytoplasma]|nr:hypothetical protein [Sweet potato little leaf phytoplasma]